MGGPNEYASFSLSIYIIKPSATAKSLQSCLTLCDPIEGSPPGSPVLGILQARTLEWVAISFSKAGKWKVKVKSLSRVRLLATPWTAAYQAPLSMGFSRHEYWSGCHCLLHIKPERKAISVSITLLPKIYCQPRLKSNWSKYAIKLYRKHIYIISTDLFSQLFNFKFFLIKGKKM